VSPNTDYREPDRAPPNRTIRELRPCGTVPRPQVVRHLQRGVDRQGAAEDEHASADRIPCRGVEQTSARPRRRFARMPCAAIPFPQVGIQLFGVEPATQHGAPRVRIEDEVRAPARAKSCLCCQSTCAVAAEEARLTAVSASPTHVGPDGNRWWRWRRRLLPSKLCAECSLDRERALTAS
jgi:hypothetical protein